MMLDIFKRWLRCHVDRGLVLLVATGYRRCGQPTRRNVYLISLGGGGKKGLILTISPTRIHKHPSLLHASMACHICTLNCFFLPVCFRLMIYIGISTVGYIVYRCTKIYKAGTT